LEKAFPEEMMMTRSKGYGGGVCGVGGSIAPGRGGCLSWEDCKKELNMGEEDKAAGKQTCHSLPGPGSESEVAQSCPTLSDPMDCSPPGFSWIFQAKVLEWVPLPSPKGIIA